MNIDDAIAEADRLMVQATTENRAFAPDEQRRFEYLMLIAKECTVDTQELDQPLRPTRPIVQAVRSLSEAARKDGFVARMLEHGRAQIALPISIKALGSTLADSPDPSIAIPSQSLGVVSTYSPIVNRLLAALASIPVTSNSVSYTRLTYSPDIGSPSTSGNAARKVQELSAKPESTLSTEEVETPIETFAHWIDCSKQVLSDATGLRAMLDLTLVAGLLDKTDAEIFLDMTEAGRFSTHTPVSGDTIGDGIARVATTLLTAGATGVKVAVNPATLLAAAIAKTSGSGEYLGLPDIAAQIVSAATVPVGKVLAWSDSGAVWAAREGVSVVAGWKDQDFVKNKITLLAEHRGAVLTLNARHVYYGNAAA